MGIPKFYRWMSERYPCLSQVVQEAEVCPLPFPPLISF
jgi:5'-3' exonuclease